MSNWVEYLHKQKHKSNVGFRLKYFLEDIPCMVLSLIFNKIISRFRFEVIRLANAVTPLPCIIVSQSLLHLTQGFT